MRRSHLFELVCCSLLCFFAVLLPNSAHADGTEILGPASIPVAGGSDFAVGGVGLYEEVNGAFVNLDGDISVTVPDGAVVTQVLLYWISEHYQQTGPDNTASVNGIPLPGSRSVGQRTFSRRSGLKPSARTSPAWAWWDRAPTC